MPPLVTVIGALILTLGVRIAQEGKLMLQVDGETLLRQDPRRPVLYLRDFRNAEANTSSYQGITTTNEERLAMVMNQVGPFIALGEPKYVRKTDFGAARLYVGDDWQDKVKELLSKAKLVVIRIDLGGHPNPAI